jgi:hypothetical protein
MSISKVALATYLRRGVRGPQVPRRYRNVSLASHKWHHLNKSQKYLPAQKK